MQLQPAVLSRDSPGVHQQPLAEADPPGNGFCSTPRSGCTPNSDLKHIISESALFCITHILF